MKLGAEVISVQLTKKKKDTEKKRKKLQKNSPDLIMVVFFDQLTNFDY